MNPTISTSHSDAAFFRDRKAALMYPVIILPFIAVLFWMFGGGKGERYVAQQAASGKPGAGGFNANVPTAKSGTIIGRDVEKPGYGKAIGQVLSSFTNTRHDSITRGLKAIPVSEKAATNHASSLASVNTRSQGAPYEASPSVKATAPTRRHSSSRKNEPPYYYQPPGYVATGSDQQVASQLKTYEGARDAALAKQPVDVNPPTGDAIPASRVGEDFRGATVLVSDNLTATRLSDPVNAEDAFYTAPTSGSRRQAERAVLSGGNSYGSKKTIAWMIPVVVHEDQTFKSGNTVKLRLTKEISADGITIPINTILHAICQASEDRLRMIVHSVQVHGQLIPLDLEVYDIDGLAGVNMPGLSNQANGQLQSSAIQGLQLPNVGGLVSTVASQARMQASQSLRQSTVRLKAGYNLYLKAQ